MSLASDSMIEYLCNEIKELRGKQKAMQAQIDELKIGQIIVPAHKQEGLSKKPVVYLPRFSVLKIGEKVCSDELVISTLCNAFSLAGMTPRVLHHEETMEENSISIVLRYMDVESKSTDSFRCTHYSGRVPGISHWEICLYNSSTMKVFRTEKTPLVFPYKTDDIDFMELEDQEEIFEAIRKKKEKHFFP